VAWDTEGTRQRLKDAATTEFAANGLEGTTMSRIAERAGINKERLYYYFGDKRALWELVLTEKLNELAASVAEQGADLGDIGAFAAATFDYHAAHPDLARLLQWEGLSHDPPADATNRITHYREKVDRFATAQHDGVLDPGLDPAHLSFALIALCAWWQTVPQLAEMITGASGDDVAEVRRRREFVIEAARRLAAPR
jgi:AcrR family transcriptional regulator